jgi:hypothetical protein
LNAELSAPGGLALPARAQLTALLFGPADVLRRIWWHVHGGLLIRAMTCDDVIALVRTTDYATAIPG